MRSGISLKDQIRSSFHGVWDQQLPSIIRHVLRRGRELLIPLDYLVNGVKEVLLGHRLPPGTNGKHTSFRAHTANVCARAVGTETSQELETDVPFAIHGTCVNLENLCPTFEIWQRELDLPVQSSRTQQGRIQCIWPVRGHQYLDVSTSIKAIQLIHDFKHRTLHLVVPSCPIVEPCATNGVHLVEEDDARFLRSGHFEQLSHHPGALSYIFLYKFATNDADEASICSIGHCSCQQGFPGPWWSVTEHAFGRIDAKLYELLRMQEG
mmetsp:Transcript_10769/g.66461  ORF Transcript_10769/g.66461 Transcript_10769/m.66461 type:complete len:266 (+) Transcript_10769:826-1623(+)